MSAEPSLKFRQSGTSCSRAVAKPYWVTESCDRNVRGQDRVVANSFSLLLGSPVEPGTCIFETQLCLLAPRAPQ